MKRMLLGVLAVGLAGFFVAVAPGTAHSDDYEAWDAQYVVRLYQHADYGGEMLELRVYKASNTGEYKLEMTLPGNSGSGGHWRNTISSFSTTSSYPAHWWMYDGMNTPNSTLLQEGDGSREDLTDSPAYNDMVESFRIQCPSDKSWTQFTIYEHPDYGGAWMYFKLYKNKNSNDVVIEIRELNGFWNDQISSIQTEMQPSSGAEAYYWYFYVDRAYNNNGGANLELSLDYPDDNDLSDNGLNDKLTSFRLVLDTQEGGATTSSSTPHELPNEQIGGDEAVPPNEFLLHSANFDGAVGDPMGWTQVSNGLGDFAALYLGFNVYQEDPCEDVVLFLWGFFDDWQVTNYMCHAPDPLPDVGAIPFGQSGSDYLNDEIWSPAIPNTGTGTEYRLTFKTYRDLPLDNLIMYRWRVRSKVGGIWEPWRHNGYYYYGGHRDWATSTFQVGGLIDATATDIQIALNAVDLYDIWGGIYGTGACHSQGPLFDEVTLVRKNDSGPQWVVRACDLFQDNFAQDGSATGFARADMAMDISPAASIGTILPGDSIVATISPVGLTGGGLATYLYARVQNSNRAVPTGAQMQSTDGRMGLAQRFPFKGTWSDGSETWNIFQGDSCVTWLGTTLDDRYCYDLNEAVFVPGDTIWYFLAADLGGGTDASYYHRTLNGQGEFHRTSIRAEAAASPMEFTILPAGGFNNGGDILYVDDADDRGGPSQLYFDSAFEELGILDEVDRYDVLDPSAACGNSLASRVKAVGGQITPYYKKIIWNSSNLSVGTVGDGTGSPEKSDDWALLNLWISTSERRPGLLLMGDDIAEELNTKAAPSGVAFRAAYIPHTLISGDHVAAGEPVSPTLTAVGTYYTHTGIPDQLVAYGGCSVVNDFDVLDPTMTSNEEYPWPNAETAAIAGSAVISNARMNTAGDTCHVILAGFGYEYIRDAVPAYPQARTEFLRDALIHLENAIAEATGIDDDVVRYTNFLDNNYPNPFNPITKIKYGIKEHGHVSLKVYNAAGQLVRTLVDEVLIPAQVKPVEWNGTNNAGQSVSSGVYFYKLVSAGFVQTKKMVVLK